MNIERLKERMEEYRKAVLRLKEAFAAGLIFDGDVWIDMINARNLTVQTYNERGSRNLWQGQGEILCPLC